MINAKIPEDMMIKHYKFKIYPTEQQKRSIDRCIELRRFIYNWALEIQNNQYIKYISDDSEKSILSKGELEKLYTILRHTEGYEFLNEMPSIAGRLAIWDLCKAFDRFFKGQNNYPKFKSKKRSKQSYRVRNDRMFINGRYIKLEGLDLIDLGYETGFVKSNFKKVYNPVISKDLDDNYYVSFGLLTKYNIDYFDIYKIPKAERAIGIDLNVKKRFVLSNGTIYYAPETSKLEKRIIRQQRKVQKDLKRSNSDNVNLQSKRAKKRSLKYHKLTKKLTNINENFIQTTTKRIIELRPSMIVMENIRNRGFIKNIKHYTNHAKFYRCREVMEKKASNYGIPFKLANANFKSSQICSNCGNVKNIYSKKKYICPICGMKMDRDLNAALNLEHLAYDDFKYSFIA